MLQKELLLATGGNQEMTPISPDTNNQERDDLDDRDVIVEGREINRES